ncbi:MAG TPA: TetR/AcrR family transcriptional regulator [Bryobacteraceae bacterium]|jgi:TetR/AcrR family transcriptional regulator
MDVHPSAFPAAPESDAPQRRLSSGDRRRQLIRSAVGLFSRHGFSGTRTKDIASACGVSEAILFRHFATKEDLYRAILDEQHQDSGAEEWLREMHELADRRDDSAFVRCLFAQILKSFRENTPFHRLLLFASLDGHALADLFHERLGWPTFEFMRGYFEQRQREGAFRKCDSGAAVLFVISAAVHYGTIKHLFSMPGLSSSDDEIANQFAAFALDGIGMPAAPKRRGARG